MKKQSMYNKPNTFAKTYPVNMFNLSCSNPTVDFTGEDYADIALFGHLEPRIRRLRT
jgi:hypothetical protein